MTWVVESFCGNVSICELTMLRTAQALGSAAQPYSFRPWTSNSTVIKVDVLVRYWGINTEEFIWINYAVVERLKVYNDGLDSSQLLSICSIITRFTSSPHNNLFIQLSQSLISILQSFYNSPFDIKSS